MTNRLPFAGGTNVRARCPQCGKTWPAETLACLSCSAELGGDTVLEDVDDTKRQLGLTTSITTDVPDAFDSRISTGQTTAQSPRAVEVVLPTAQPASDPTTSTKLDTSYVHLVPGTLVGEYEVEKLLGSGGMGAVYGARHERLHKKVAIKVIAPNLSADQSAVERFEQEALALAKMSHPNIVTVLSIGSLPGDGRNYYVMEWLDGESLYDRLARSRFPVDEALDILDQIARGLDAAHAAGIVHRDLKPDNCWLQRVGDESRVIVKILDLGLAKLAEHRRTKETAVNVMFGTPSYMSPEQCQSARDVGPETDVYALGCIAYELLCGQLPFTYDNAAELVVAHGSELPPTPRSLNPTLSLKLDPLLTSMLAKDPSRRPTLAEVRRSIAIALAAPANASRPPTIAPPLSPVAQPSPASTVDVDAPRTSRRVLVAFAGLVVLGVVAATIIATSGGPSLGARGPVGDEARNVLKIDADAATIEVADPGVTLDANAPLAMPAQSSDAGTVTPQLDANPETPAIVRGRVRAQSKSKAVTKLKPAPVDAATVSEGVESDDATSPEVTPPPVNPVPTKPAPQQTRPTPTTKLPNRNVIINPFKKKAATK